MKPKSLPETKDIIQKLMVEKFQGGATHRMITVEIEEMNVFVPDRKIYDALKELKREEFLDDRKLPKGGGLVFFIPAKVEPV